MPEGVLMCPTCQAIVGGGDYDDETFSLMEALAKQSGLQMLRMWADCNAPHSGCTCPAPAPIHRFVALIQMRSDIATEYKDERGRWHKGLPECSKLPAKPNLKNLSREDAEAELSRWKSAMEAGTGMEMRDVKITFQPVPKCHDHVPPGWAIFKTFQIGGFNATFHALGKGKFGHFSARIIEDHGFQIWPSNPGDSLTAPSRRIAMKRFDEDVLAQFVLAMARVKQAEYDDWVGRCLAQRQPAPNT